MVEHGLPVESEFMRWWFAAVDQLSPEESAGILTRTSEAEFVKVMRMLLPPEESKVITDAQLHILHDAMCERLQAKAGKTVDSWEGSAPAGQA